MTDRTHYDTCWMYHLGCAVRRVARLEADLAGQRRAATDEKCAAAEDHCACVAVLRSARADDAAEIARLCAALAAAEARAKAENERLRGLLGEALLYVTAVAGKIIDAALAPGDPAKATFRARYGLDEEE